MSEPDVFAAATRVVESARAAVVDITCTEFWKVPDRDLLTLARRVEQVARLVHTAQVHLAGEVDTRGIAAAHGAASTAGLLRTALGVSQGDARSLVATAAVVLPRDVPSGGELPPALPLLAGALAEGGLGVAQTRTVVSTMRKLPATVDEATRDLVQQQLVAQGRVTEPAPFAVFARAILVTLDQDGKDFDQDPPADHMEFTLGTRNPNTGLTRITGQVDDIGVEIINQAIDTLSKPQPGTTSTSNDNTSGNTGSGTGGQGSTGGQGRTGGQGGGTDAGSGGGNGRTDGMDGANSSSGVNSHPGSGNGSGGGAAGGSGNGNSGGGGGVGGRGGGNRNGGGNGGRRGGKWAADPRPAATRRAQAILEALRRFLDLGDAPLHGGERPHITVTMTLQDLLGPQTGTTARACTCAATTRTADANTTNGNSHGNSNGTDAVTVSGPGDRTGAGGSDHGVNGSNRHGADRDGGNSAGRDGTGSSGTGSSGTGRGERSIGTNGGNGRHSTGAPHDRGPGHNPAPKSGPPPVLDYGGPITPAQARTLACDARIIPAVLGGSSQVLDIGTSNRLFPPHIRRAIALRDKGCTFPGCDRPPGWTDAHHISFWADNGRTAYHNGCLLCRHHHSEIHRGHWTITIAPDGVPDFTPPPWVDPTRTPQRNTLHHIPTLLGM